MTEPIPVSTTVDNLEAVLSLFNQIKVHRSTTGTNGPYVEITTSGTRVPLEPGKIVYEFIDLVGEEDFFYRVSYFHSSTSQESSLSDPQQAGTVSALDIVSIQELKTNYLFGLDLTDDAGNPMPDSLFTHYIQTAVDWVETTIDISVAPKSFEGRDAPADFLRQEYYKYIWIQLVEYPIIRVDKVELVLPTEQTVIEFDPEWFNLHKESGQLMIIPGNGQLSTIVLGQTGAWLPLIYGWTDFIPDVFRISYTVGFEKNKVPFMIKDLVGKVASLGPLNLAGDLISGAGIAAKSISLDGLSQSISTTSSATNAGFGARILQYTREIKESTKTLQRYYKGVRMRVA